MKLERKGLVLEPDGKDIGAIFNCGAVEYNGLVYLLPRVIKDGYRKTSRGFENYISEIWVAKSDDGEVFTLLDEPILRPEKPYNKYGCEDPRVTKLYDEYLITYTALSSPAFSGHGNRVGLASTKDFVNLETHGTVGPDENNKDAVIFPEYINGKIAMLHRIEPNIQIIYFNDVEEMKNNPGSEFWDKYMKDLDKYTVLERKYKWESKKIGAGPPPIKTKEGWLLIYHAVDRNKVYRAGAALLDLDDPQKVIARSPEPILEPEMDYERKGDVPNVVFPEGAVVKDGKLLVYYGAADKRCCLATCELDNLLDFLLKRKS